MSHASGFPLFPWTFCVSPHLPGEVSNGYDHLGPLIFPTLPCSYYDLTQANGFWALKTLSLVSSFSLTCAFWCLFDNATWKSNGTLNWMCPKLKSTDSLLQVCSSFRAPVSSWRSTGFSSLRGKIEIKIHTPSFLSHQTSNPPGNPNTSLCPS